MKKIFSMKVWIVLCAVIISAVIAMSATLIAADMESETSNHPRIASAITQLQDAIDYMKAAPHDFGGHKKAAIADSEKAIKQLKLALQYREKQDNKKKSNYYIYC